MFNIKSIKKTIRMCVPVLLTFFRTPPKEHVRWESLTDNAACPTWALSGCSQDACALRLTVGHWSLSGVSHLSIHKCHSRTPHVSDMTFAPRWRFQSDTWKCRTFSSLPGNEAHVHSWRLRQTNKLACKSLVQICQYSLRAPPRKNKRGSIYILAKS